MDRRISHMRRSFLTDESRLWVERGLISEAQRSGILESYAAAGYFPTAILVLGVTMVGLGVLSFIAANWKILPNELKIAMIVGSYAASVAGAYLCEKRSWRALSDAFLLLSGFLLMGGLALISQIFHIVGSPTDLLETWMLLYLPTLLLARGIAIYALYEVTALVYINILYARYAWRPRSDHFQLVTPWQPLLLLALLVAVAWWFWFRERDSESEPSSKLRAVFVGGSTRKIFLSNFFILNWFTWLCIVNSRHDSLLPYIMGILAIGVLISLSAWKLDASDLDLQGLLCVGLAGFALTFRLAWVRFSYGYYGHYQDADELIFRLVMSSIVLGAYLLWRVARQRRYAALSAFLFCAVLARWYFDMFYNFMSKSLFFTSGGVLLLLAAYACHRWNKMAGEKKAAVAAAGSEGGGGDARGL